MRCVRETGMRVLTVHSRIYINCTLDGRLLSELHCAISFPQNISFLSSLSSVAHCITIALQMKVSGSIAGVADVFYWVLLLILANASDALVCFDLGRDIMTEHVS